MKIPPAAVATLVILWSTRVPTAPALRRILSGEGCWTYLTKSRYEWEAYVDRLADGNLTDRSEHEQRLATRRRQHALVGRAGTKELSVRD